MRRTTPVRWLVLGLALFAATAVSVRDAAAAARTWLGVYTQEITDDLRDGLDLHGADGVLVNRVIAGSPASDAGLRKGDVIVSFNSRNVTDPQQLGELVRSSRDGQEVALGIIRDGDRRTLSATLGRQRDTSDDDEDDDSLAPPPPPAPRAPRAPRAPEARDGEKKELRIEVQGKDGDDRKVRVWKNGEEVDPDEIGDLDDMPMIKSFKMSRDSKVLDGLRGLEGLKHLKMLDGDGGPGGAMMLMNGERGRLGVRVESLNEDLASALGASGSRGALVLEVVKGSAAEKAGIRAGDVITSLDGTRIEDADDLVKAVREQDGKVAVSVLRRGVARTLQAELEDAPREMVFKRGAGQLGMGRMGDGERRIRIRTNDRDGADTDGLRQQMDELRQQLRELRQELEERKHD